MTQESTGTNTPTRPGRPRNGEDKGRSVPIDAHHSALLDEYTSWYFPSGAANLTVVLHEMMDIAYGIAKADKQRAESPEDRRERLIGKGKGGS